jgi:polysaccharide pyruvyl transferase WcaK-like protein
MSVFKRIGLGQWLSRRLTDRLTVEYAAKFPASEAGDYEAVFFAGGEQWSGYSNGITMLSVLLAVSKSNKNLSIFPFSVKKKLLEFHSLPLLQSCFSRFVGKLVVRDSHSGEIVRRFAPAVVNGADCVFSLADEALPLPPAPGRNADAVMLAVTTGNGSRLPDLTATIRALQGAGFRVRLLTTCEREDGEDLRRLGRELGVEALAPATWQETVSEFKSSAMVVTNRLHCMIFTLFADVPLVPLLNREKVVGIHHDAELPHALRHSAELTPAKVRECLGDAGLIRAKMSVYLEKVLRSELSP